MSGFRIRGLPAADFSQFFSMNDIELERHGARRMLATDNGFPCRISLTDARAGDEVILVNYQHHRTESPFRSSFALYVREGEAQFEAMDEIPEQLRKRLLSLRGYDAQGMLRAAEIADGQELEAALEAMFSFRDVAYIHLHFAKPGCYAALVERA
jgi:Protein of unknown function (DUF1203)